MKKVIFIGLLLSVASAVSAQSTVVAELATKLADRMKDSLTLTETQRSAVLNANLQLANDKQGIWQANIGSDSLQVQLQRVENRRDSLYKSILPAEKFELYQIKKRGIINNN